MPIADGALFGGYTIVRLLGTGGMGEVYLARHPRLPRLEALKILPLSVSADPEYRQRFAREADIAASLWHPYVVAIHDRGEHEGQLWIAMDYVEGTDAAQLMRDRYPHGMPPKEAVEIVSNIADALDYAHERYLLHRDVKPANILITDARKGDRRILLADFGIAKAANDTHGLTATDMTIGSVAYAAPEQLMGNPLDGRADQYALACTAFHLLTGAPPFVSANPAAVIGSHLSAPPPPVSKVRPDLGSIESVLVKAMSKVPSQRFGTCREFAAALSHGDTAWISSSTATQMAPTPTAPPRDWVPEAQSVGPVSAPSKSRTALMVAGGAAALLAVGVVAFVGARLAQSPSAPPPPAATPQTSSPWQETRPAEPRRPPPLQPPPPGTVTKTATVTAAPVPPRPAPAPAPAPRRPIGDLGLSTPMSYPICNGQWIVVLGNVTTPGMYAGGIRELLDAHPGASYLRTDQSCPSLRQADDEGDPIYAVYRYGGTSQGQACAAVAVAADGAYAKVLNYSTPPSYIPCRK